MNTNNKFTPGPWKIDKHTDNNNTVVRAASGDIVADCQCDYDNIGLVQQTVTANARLIACCPEMLEALENLLAYYEDLHAGLDEDDLSNSELMPEVVIARSIIAKAKGE